MTNLIDFILDLFRDPVRARAFVNDPNQAMRDAGVSNASAAQVQAVAATAAPSLALGDGDPVVGLQRAVAAHHSIVPAIAQEPTYAPATSSNADLLSHNDTHVLSPETTIVEDHSFKLDFSGFTLGDKVTAEGTGAVAIGGANSGDILTAEGSALGTGNHVNNGGVDAGTGAVVNLGQGNVIVDPTAPGGQPPYPGVPATAPVGPGPVIDPTGATKHPTDPAGVHPADPAAAHPMIDPSLLHPTDPAAASHPMIDPSHLHPATVGAGPGRIDPSDLKDASNLHPPALHPVDPDPEPEPDPASHLPPPHLPSPLPDPTNPLDPLHIFG
jgi:hypothetical protein